MAAHGGQVSITGRTQVKEVPVTLVIDGVRM
jgi:hypothetical protein